MTEEDREMFQQAAANTLKKTQSISIRLSEKDLADLKARAEEAGIPYQTLITALIRQFNNRKIKLVL